MLSIIDKMLKQRRESIAQFEKAARNDLADAEKAEIAVLSAYLPQQMSEAEVAEAIAGRDQGDRARRGRKTWAKSWAC